MSFTVEFDGRRYVGLTGAEVMAKGVPMAVIGAALKVHAMSGIAAFADSYRGRIATKSPGKLAEYRVKEEIARDPTTASDAEMALIAREAAARGIDTDTLVALINGRAAAYRQIALLIGALETEVRAAIDAIPDDAADIEAQIGAVFESAKTEADTEYQAAVALMAGA